MEAINFFTKANILESLIIAKKDLGHYYAEEGDFQRSENAFLESIAIAEKIGSDYTLIVSYQGLSALYEEWGNPGKALVYYKKYDEVNQRVFNAETHKQLANYEIKYLTREKEIENELLKNENRLKQNRLIFLLLALGSLLCITVLLIYGIRLKNKSLKQQKILASHELSEKEKEKQHFEDKIFAEQQINRLQQEQYQQNIEHKNQVLVNSTLSLVHKNEFLIDLKNMIAEEGKDQDRQIGVVAQEIEEILPEIVSTDVEGIKSVDYSKLSALLIEAVKTQQEQIEALEARISELER